MKAPYAAGRMPTAKATDSCECLRRQPQQLNRVLQVARQAQRTLATDPVPIKIILDMIPCSVSPSAQRVIRVMAAAARAGQLFDDLVEAGSPRSTPCGVCARRTSPSD